MYRHTAIGSLVASIALVMACERGREVQEETLDLREAQKNVGKVSQELEADLNKAKAEVLRLEQKVALAKQGITDDVLAERRELEESLKEQQRRVETEINEAKREAQLHTREAEQAVQQLGQTQPPAAVEAKLSTETQVVRQPGALVETTPREELIPVKGGPEPRVYAADAGADSIGIGSAATPR